MLEKALLLKNLTLHTPHHAIDCGAILVQGEKITALGASSDIEPLAPEETICIAFNEPVDALPGFIDLHIHGANGADIMDASATALHTIAAALPAEGTTGFLATTMTGPDEAIEGALKTVAQWQPKPHEAQCLGIHLEGPFLGDEFAGAQCSTYFRDPDIKQFFHWQHCAQNKIKMATLAPERKNAHAFIEALEQSGVIAALGHSGACYEAAEAAIQCGAKHITHLFNAMSGLHHRTPGLALAALLNPEVKAEIIADGIHVHPKMLELAFQLKGPEGLILVSDAMRAKCLPPGQYAFGGHDVTVDRHAARLPDHTLAGSILRLIDAFFILKESLHLHYADLIKMSSETPARQLGLFDTIGSLEVGKQADLTVINRSGKILYTLCRGSIAYSNPCSAA